MNIALEKKIREFNRLAKEYDSMAKVSKLEDNYVDLLDQMSDQQFEHLVNKLERDEEMKYFPDPKTVRRICKIYKSKAPEKKMQQDHFDPVGYCRYCLDSGLIPVLNADEKEVSMRCKCSAGAKRNNFPDYFDVFPNFQFAWNQDAYDNYPEAFLDVKYQRMAQRATENNAPDDNIYTQALQKNAPGVPF